MQIFSLDIIFIKLSIILQNIKIIKKEKPFFENSRQKLDKKKI